MTSLQELSVEIFRYLLGFLAYSAGGGAVELAATSRYFKEQIGTNGDAIAFEQGNDPRYRERAQGFSRGKFACLGRSHIKSGTRAQRARTFDVAKLTIAEGSNTRDFDLGKLNSYLSKVTDLRNLVSLDITDVKSIGQGGKLSLGDVLSVEKTPNLRTLMVHNAAISLHDLPGQIRHLSVRGYCVGFEHAMVVYPSKLRALEIVISHWTTGVTLRLPTQLPSSLLSLTMIAEVPFKAEGTGPIVWVAPDGRTAPPSLQTLVLDRLNTSDLGLFNFESLPSIRELCVRVVALNLLDAQRIFVDQPQPQHFLPNLPSVVASSLQVLDWNFMGQPFRLSVPNDLHKMRNLSRLRLKFVANLDSVQVVQLIARIEAVAQLPQLRVLSLAIQGASAFTAGQARDLLLSLNQPRRLQVHLETPKGTTIQVLGEAIRLIKETGVDSIRSVVSLDLRESSFIHPHSPEADERQSSAARDQMDFSFFSELEQLRIDLRALPTVTLPRSLNQIRMDCGGIPSLDSLVEARELFPTLPRLDRVQIEAPGLSDILPSRVFSSSDTWNDMLKTRAIGVVASTASSGTQDRPSLFLSREPPLRPLVPRTLQSFGAGIDNPLRIYM